MQPRSLLARHRVDLVLFAAALCAYALSSGSLLAHQSLAPHFVWQAQAFLHGQLAMLGKPPNLNDWVLQDGRWYVSFPPFPAVLMMPGVALFGLAFNDVAFTLVFAAANVALFYRLLRRLEGDEGGVSDAAAGAGVLAPAHESESRHALFALLFGFGTLAWSCGIRGEVWFTAETIGVTLTLLYLHASLRARHPVLAGLSVACAAITRTPLAFSAVFFVCEALFAKGPVRLARLREPGKLRAALGRIIPYGLAILAVAIPMALVNHARFGSFSEFGHSHLYANRVNEQVQRYGLFHYAFLERNLHAAFTRLPELQFNPFKLGFNGDGMSLFVTTPLFFWLLWPRQQTRLHRSLWLTCALVAVPGFFYQNSGWFQFGFRFSLDYTPYLLLILALSGHRLTKLFWAAAALGVAVNAWGAMSFNRLY